MGRYFTKETKRAAFAAATGADGVPRCRCTAELRPGKYRYDHIVPYELSRDSSGANCHVLCDACDAAKTYGEDLPAIAKVKRQQDRHIGAWRSRHPMPCGRQSKLRKTMDGKVIARVTPSQRIRAMREGRS